MNPCGDFNAFVLENMHASSDVQGKVAVGGNATFENGFSVGDQLKDVTCADSTLIVRETLSWNSGQNYFGSIEAGASFVSTSVLNVGCTIKRFSGSVGFESCFADLLRQSLSFCSLPSTVAHDELSNGLWSITFLPSTGLNVVNVPSGYFQDKVKTFALFLTSSLPIIFNIMEEDAIMQNMDQSALSKYSVLFNFCKAKRLFISGISVEGTILAPLASLPSARGVVQGI